MPTGDTRSTIQDLQKLYAEHPDVFTDEEKRSLDQSVSFLNIAPYKAPAGHFDLLRSIEQPLEGFVQGFSTINVGDEPRNDIEYIGRNIGHLLGFVGYVPGYGSLGKLASMGIARTIGLTARGAEALKLTGTSARLVEAAKGTAQSAGLMRFTSIPNLVSETVMGGLKNVARNSAAFQGIKFLESGRIARDVIEGGLSLGIASAASGAQPWELELDKRMEAFKSGVEAGVVFRGMGNVFVKGGKLDFGKWMGGSIERQAAVNTITRSVAAAAYLGVPSTFRNDPTPVQIYEYVQGALFGALEKPAYMREMEAFRRPYEASLIGQAKLLRWKDLPGADKLSENAKDEMDMWASLTLGRWESMTGMTDSARAILKGFKGASSDLVADGKITQDEALSWERAQAMERIKEDVEKEAAEKGITDPNIITSMVFDETTKQYVEWASQMEQHLKDFNTESLDKLNAMLDMADLLTSADRKDLLDVYSDRGVSLSYHRPLDVIAGKMAELDTETSRLDHQKSLLAMVERSRKKSKDAGDSFQAFQTELQEKYPKLGLNEETVGQLRTVWTRSTLDRVVKRLTYDEKGNLVLMGNLDAEGKSAIRNRPFTFLEQSIAGTVYELDEIPVKENGRTVMKPVHDADVNQHYMLYQAYTMLDKDGKPRPLLFVGGSKDNSKLLFADAIARQFVEDGVRKYMVKLENGLGVVKTFEQRIAAMQDALNAITKSGKEPENVIDTYRKNFEEFKREFEVKDAKGNVGYSVNTQELERMYEHFYMNQLALLERLNGIPIERMIESGKGSFIMKAANLNKRMQIIHSGDYPLWAKTFDGLPGVENERIPGITVRVDLDDPNAIFKARYWKDQKLVEIVEHLGKQVKVGETTIRGVETHLDGVLVLRSDAFERTAEQMGLPKNTGGQKVTIAFTDPNTGMFLGKLLLHRASPDMDAHLMSKKLVYQIYDTAAKQPGLNKMYTERFVNGQVRYFEGDKEVVFSGEAPTTEAVPKTRLNPANTELEIVQKQLEALESEHDALEADLENPRQDLAILVPGATIAKQQRLQVIEQEHLALLEKQKTVKAQATEIPAATTTQPSGVTPQLTWIPATGIRMNFSAGEHADFSDVRAKIQFSGNMSTALQKLWEERMQKRAFVGDPEMHKLFKMYQNAKPEELAGIAKTIDVRKLGAQKILDILEAGVDGPLFRKVAQDLLNYAANTPQDQVEDITDAESHNEALLLGELQSAAKRILSVGETTPLILQHKLVRPYVQTILRNYLRDLVVKPWMDYSWRSKSYGTDLYLQHKYQLKEGEYMAAAGLKAKVIQVDGRKMTMGKAWDELNNPKTIATRKATLEEALEHFVMRVPADSASGIRILKFKGFVDMKDQHGEDAGFGVYLHPQDMVNLGGMDQDGDAVDVYTQIPDRELHTQAKEYFRSKANQWMEDAYQRGPDGKLQLAGKVMQPSSNKDFLDPAYSIQDSDAPEVKLEKQDRINRLSSVASLADPLTLLRINQWAYRGNTLLGPGLVFVRRLQELQRMAVKNGTPLSWDIPFDEMARLKAAGKLPGLERLGENQKKEYQRLAGIPRTKRSETERQLLFELDDATRTSKFQYVVENADPQVLVDAMRNVVNSAADAATGDAMIGREAMRQVLVTKAFKNASVSYLDGAKKVFEAKGKPPTFIGGVAKTAKMDVRDVNVGSHPYYRSLQNIDQVLKGRNNLGRPYCMHEVLGALGNIKQGIQGEPSHSWYRAGLMLGNLKPRVNMFSFVNQEGFIAYKEHATNILRAKPELAKLAFRHDLNINTDGIERYIASNQDKLSPTQLAEDVNDLALNDIYLTASVTRLMDVGQDFLDEQAAKRIDEKDGLKELESIADRAELVRQQDDYRKNNDQVLQLMGLTEKRKTAQEIHDQTMEYFKSLSPAGQKYFSTYLLGSSYRQTRDYIATMEPYKQAIDEANKKVDAAKSQNDQKALLAAKVELRQAKAAFMDAKEDFYRNGITKVGYSFDFVPTSAIKDLLHLVNKIAQVTYKPNLSEQDVKDVLSNKATTVSLQMREVVPESKNYVPAHKIEKFINDFTTHAQAAFGSTEKLDPDLELMSNQIRALLYHYKTLMPHFEGLLEGMLGKGMDIQHSVSPYRFTKPMLRAFIDQFMYKGKFWWELSEKEKHFALARRHYVFDPDLLAKQMAAGDVNIVETVMPVYTKEGQVAMKPVNYVLSHFGTITEVMHYVHAAYNGTSRRKREELEFGAPGFEGGLLLVRQLGEDGERIFSLVSHIRQRDLDRRLKFLDGKGDLNADDYGPAYSYKEAAEKAEADFANEYGPTSGKATLYYTNSKGERLPISAEEVKQRITNIQNSWATYAMKFITNPEAEAKFLKLIPGTNIVDVRETQKELFKRIREGLPFPEITLNALYRLRHGMKVDRIVAKNYKANQDDVTGKDVLLGDITNMEHKKRYIEQFRKQAINASGWMDYEDIKTMNPSEYFPHGGFSPKQAEEFRKKESERQKRLGKSKEKQLEAEVDVLNMANASVADDGGITDVLWQNSFDNPIRIDPENASMEITKLQPPPVLQRGIEPIPGWDTSTETFWRYTEQMMRGIHNMTGALMSNAIVENFVDKNVFGEHTGRWANYMRMYINEAIGQPTLFPKDVLKDPGMFLNKTNPYYWFTDNALVKMKKIEQKFGIEGDDLHFIESYKGERSKITKELSELRSKGRQLTIKKGDEAEIKAIALQAYELQKRMVKLDERAQGLKDENVNLEQAKRAYLLKVRRFANLEAKWEMVSLLSHTKTMTNNLFDGNLNTAISAGFKHWKLAGDTAWLRKNINPKATSYRDFIDMAERFGAGESYIIDVLEQGSSAGQAKTLGEGIRDIRKVIATPKEQRENTVLGTIEGQGWFKKTVNAGALFMRLSERQLRNRAWLAHYLKAWEVLEANHVEVRMDDPWLIRMANRGVAGTQFLYDNAGRPPFARTTLGRIFGRFQMYAWKSTLMRKEINDQAKMFGFKPGTEAYSKLQRRVTADLFMWGLATIFPASLFNAALGGPLQQVQQASLFFFGDDKVKKNAFNSPLPYPLNALQMVSPPIMRVPYGVFGTMMTGNWDRFMGYHVRTWFPFGRVFNDVVGSLGNPVRTPEKMLGLPFGQMAQEVQRDEKKNRPNYFLRGIL